MHVAFIVVSAVLALEMAGAGVPKLLQLSAVRRNGEHLGVSEELHRMIGVAEIAAAVSLLVGIAYPPLAIVTGVAVCLLMCGAVGYHVKAGDKVSAMLPAVLTAVMAVVVALLAGVTASQ
jgi:DoxX-like family